MIRYCLFILFAYNLINSGYSVSLSEPNNDGQSHTEPAHYVVVNRGQRTIALTMGNNFTLKFKTTMRTKHGGPSPATPVTPDTVTREQFQEKQPIYKMNYVTLPTTTASPDTTTSTTTEYIKPNVFTDRPPQAVTTDKCTTSTSTSTTSTTSTTTGAPAGPDDDSAVELFRAGDKLANLTFDEKCFSVLALTAHYDADPGQTLGPLVRQNLIAMMAYTPQLFPVLTQPALDAVLSIAADNPCAWYSVPRAVRDRFVDGALSLSAGTLYRAYRPALVAVLAVATASRETATGGGGGGGLSRRAVENLVTLLALSGGQRLFSALPPAAVRFALRSVAQHPDLLSVRAPPSTVAGFLGALLRALTDGGGRPQSSRGRVPAQLLAATLAPALNARLLAVLPAGHYDRLLATVAECPELADALPADGLVAVFNTLAGAPALLTAVKPDRLAEALAAVVNRPTGNPLHRTVVERLLESMDSYAPRGLECLPDSFRGFYG